MLRFVKALHVVGAAMFFGSILTHITAGLVPAVMEDPETLLVARRAIGLATVYVTLPGLALMVATGGIMIVGGRLPLARLRWLSLHAAFGALIVLNAAFVLYPGGVELTALAERLVGGADLMEAVRALKAREAAFGAMNVGLGLAAILLGVIKPRLAKKPAA